MIKPVKNWDIEIRNSSLKEREEYYVKTPPNYLLRPPMPAFRHPAQVLHIPVDYQSPEHSGTAENQVWSVSRILPDYSQFGGCSRYNG